MAATDVVSLAEAKLQLNMTDTASDNELGVFISAASEAIEDYVGPVVNRSVTDVTDGGRAEVLLTKIPVASITSVTDGGTVLPAEAYKVSLTSGVVTRVSGGYPYPFTYGIQSVQVTYVAGRAANTAAVPNRYKMAALIIIQHLWETQRPAAAGPFSQGADDFDPRYTYSIPRRALEMLGAPVGGIA
jgi:uncharacterized phiE125 gp8 family phage protein